MVAAVCEVSAAIHLGEKKAYSKGKPWENAERLRSSLALYVAVDSGNIVRGGERARAGERRIDCRLEGGGEPRHGGDGRKERQERVKLERTA
jgi:hypothetical protein